MPYRKIKSPEITGSISIERAEFVAREIANRLQQRGGATEGQFQFGLRRGGKAKSKKRIIKHRK